MYLDNITAHINKGSFLGENKTNYRINSFLPFLSTLWGSIVGGRSQGFWSYFLPAMFLVSLACVVIVFKVSKYGLYLYEALWLDVVISITWILDISILELMFFTMTRKFTPWFFLIYLPNVIVPIISGILIYKWLKNENYGKNTTLPVTYKLGGLGFGLICVHFVKTIFRNAGQNQVFIIMLITLCLLNCVASMGLLSLQKLYFMKKYKISM